MAIPFNFGQNAINAVRGRQQDDREQQRQDALDAFRKAQLAQQLELAQQNAALQRERIAEEKRRFSASLVDAPIQRAGGVPFVPGPEGGVPTLGQAPIPRKITPSALQALVSQQTENRAPRPVNIDLPHLGLTGVKVSPNAAANFEVALTGQEARATKPVGTAGERRFGTLIEQLPQMNRAQLLALKSQVELSAKGGFDGYQHPLPPDQNDVVNAVILGRAIDAALQKLPQERIGPPNLFNK